MNNAGQKQMHIIKANQETAFSINFDSDKFLGKVNYANSSLAAQTVLRQLKSRLGADPDAILIELYSVCGLFSIPVNAKRLDSILIDEIEVTERGYVIRFDPLHGRSILPKDKLDDNIYIEVERTESGFLSFVVFNLDSDRKYTLNRSVVPNVSGLKSVARKLTRFMGSLERV